MPHRHRHFFLLPAVLWVGLFTLFPFLYTLALSFVHQGAFGEWTNYRRLFGTDWATNAHALSVTFIFVAVTVLMELTLGLALALFVSRSFRGRGALRGLLMVPFFVSPLAIGYLGRTIFYEGIGGPINDLLAALHLPRMAWLTQVVPAFAAVTLVDIWQWTPFCFLILLAALQSISPEVLDAAQLDCPSSFSLLRYVTLPHLKPAIATAFFLRLIEAFKMFDLPWGLTAGGPNYNATETFTMLVQREAMQHGDWEYGAAQSTFFFAVVMGTCFLFFVVVPKLRGEKMRDEGER